MLHIVENPPFVRVVGKTMPDIDAMDEYWSYRETEARILLEDTPELIAEFAGRICYQSWENPRNLSQAKYLQDQIISHLHGSVLEHVWLNFVVADLPRSVQLELVRHGDGTAFSFESQRFVDKYLRFVMPPLIRQTEEGSHIRDVFTQKCRLDEEYYYEMLEMAEAELKPLKLTKTLQRKKAKEAARSALPNCAGSDGLVSINARGLRHIIEVRSDVAADASMREFAVAVYDQAEPVLSSILNDALVDRDMEVPQIKFQHRKV